MFLIISVGVAKILFGICNKSLNHIDVTFHVIGGVTKILLL